MTVGRLDPVDLRAVEAARARALDYLRTTFPGFRWAIPLVHRREIDASGRVEPVVLIDHGVIERDARTWDYGLVVTGAELQSYYKPFALGTPSRAVSVAVLSTLRIDPAAADAAVGEEARLEGLTQRVYALALHLLGHLAGLPNEPEDETVPADVMRDIHAIGDLDGREGFSAGGVRLLEEAFEDVADLRLEETGRARRKALAFYVSVLWRNRYDIAAAVAAIRPWQFPFRLSRLTTAAASTLIVLIITAEAWDLGMTQPPAFVAGLSVFALVATTAYTIARQGLLVRRRARRLSEQRAVSNLSIVIAVGLGMGTTYALLFGVTLGLGHLLFAPTLVAGWAASLEGAIGFGHYLVLSAFVASLGIVIGALGAAFEPQGYVRHVAFVDEET